MRGVTFVVACVFVATGVQSGNAAGDAAHGERLFTTQGCISCHAINGTGGAVAADLGRQLDRGYTPPMLTSTMWNHAPAMWASMQARNVTPPALSLQDSEDLFAFFFAARFFEKPGDAARGQRLFHTKNCSACHNEGAGGARPVTEWTGMGDPMSLAEAMWNHSSVMQENLSRQNSAWPHLSAQELTDLLVYARQRKRGASASTALQISSKEDASTTLQSKGCAACHSGKLALEQRLRGMTLTEIAAEFWNHTPAMTAAMETSGTRQVHFEPGEMSRLLSFVWARQFFTGSGVPVRGKRVFESKHCNSCHEPGSLKGQFSSIRMTAVLWQHGPAMLQRMKEKGIGWPRFRDREMADLFAYLNDNSK